MYHAANSHRHWATGPKETLTNGSALSCLKCSDLFSSGSLGSHRFQGPRLYLGKNLCVWVQVHLRVEVRNQLLALFLRCCLLCPLIPDRLLAWNPLNNPGELASQSWHITGWPGSTRGPPASASLTLGLQVGSIAPGFCLGCGD